MPNKKEVVIKIIKWALRSISSCEKCVDHIALAYNVPTVFPFHICDIYITELYGIAHSSKILVHIYVKTRRGRPRW